MFSQILKVFNLFLRHYLHGVTWNSTWKIMEYTVQYVWPDGFWQGNVNHQYNSFGITVSTKGFWIEDSLDWNLNWTERFWLLPYSLAGDNVKILGEDTDLSIILAALVHNLWLVVLWCLADCLLHFFTAYLTAPLVSPHMFVLPPTPFLFLLVKLESTDARPSLHHRVGFTTPTDSPQRWTLLLSTSRKLKDYNNFMIRLSSDPAMLHPSSYGILSS